MNALEKVAWTEVIVSGSACLLVAALYPWLGYRATAGFGLLGFLAITVYFMRRRGDEIVMDERDRRIERDANLFGIGLAWQGTFLTLIAITLWHGYHKLDVPVEYLVWLVWLQFAVCYGTKGLVALRAYRGQRRAA